jgi:hypothetical protein
MQSSAFDNRVCASLRQVFRLLFQTDCNQWHAGARQVKFVAEGGNHSVIRAGVFHYTMASYGECVFHAH